MAEWQSDPGELYVPSDAPDGVYLVHKDGVRFTEFMRLADGTNTTVNIDDVTGEVQINTVEADTQDAFLVSIVGTELVFITDENDLIVTAEVPL